MVNYVKRSYSNDNLLSHIVLHSNLNKKEYVFFKNQYIRPKKTTQYNPSLTLLTTLLSETVGLLILNAQHYNFHINC